jgi:hypothetical protein
MNARSLIGVLSLLLGSAACSAVNPPYTVLNQSDYHAFVAPWDPSDQPLCVAFQSAADWEARMHPAAVIGKNTFGPPTETWREHAIVLLAREINGGDPAHRFKVTGVTRSTDADALDIHMTFTPPPASTFTAVAYVAVEVQKPLPQVIHFNENGRDVCEVRPGS